MQNPKFSKILKPKFRNGFWMGSEAPNLKILDSTESSNHDLQDSCHQSIKFKKKLLPVVTSWRSNFIGKKRVLIWSAKIRNYDRQVNIKKILQAMLQCCSPNSVETFGEIFGIPLTLKYYKYHQVVDNRCLCMFEKRFS